MAITLQDDLVAAINQLTRALAIVAKKKTISKAYVELLDLVEHSIELLNHVHDEIKAPFDPDDPQE
jgi:hypothetical protein